MTLSTVFSKYEGSNKHLSDSLCNICLDDLSQESYVVTHQGTLLHPFHFACLLNWTKYKSECPLCRREITQISDTQISSSKNQVLSISSIIAGVCASAVFFKFLGFRYFPLVTGSVTHGIQIYDQKTPEMDSGASFDLDIGFIFLGGLFAYILRNN